MKSRILVLVLLLVLALDPSARSAQQVINTGTNPNDGTGDSLRAAGTKINANFTELYGRPNYIIGTDLRLTGSTITIGDLSGTYLVKSLFTSKGDLLSYDGTNPVRHPIGSNGKVATADSTKSDGWDWEAAASGGVTSLAGLSGNITIGAGFGTNGQQIALTNPYDPTNVNITNGSATLSNLTTGNAVITGGDINGTNIGDVTQGTGKFTTCIATASCIAIGVFPGGGANAGIYTIDPVSIRLIANDAGFGASLMLLNVLSPPITPTNAGNLYVTSGSVHAQDSSGNDVIISPHALDAPPGLYEIGPGADEMHRVANPFAGTITWHATTRRQNIDALDFAGRLGTQAQSSAAWVEIAARQSTNRVICDQIETYADYQTRTGINPWPTVKAATWPTMTPSQRWVDSQADAVATSQTIHDQWTTAKAAALAAGHAFTQPEPTLYTALPPPAWCTP